MTTKQKLSAAVNDNFSARTLLAYVEFLEKESLERVRVQSEESRFRFTQGELAFQKEIIDLLTKVVSG